jgi:NAD-reducing hydrogenase small subunit
MSKKKIGTVWLAGCSGCHMSLLDIDERILEVVKLADIVKSPVVDGKEFPKVDIAIVEGAVSSEAHVEELKHIRENSRILVALGDCAVTANVPSLRNPVGTGAALRRAYQEAESNVEGKMPPGDGKGVSPLLQRAVPLHEIVKVDYYLPGCPPDADHIFEVLAALLTDKVPELPNERKASYG